MVKHLQKVPGEVIQSGNNISKIVSKTHQNLQKKQNQFVHYYEKIGSTNGEKGTAFYNSKNIQSKCSLEA